MLSFLYWITLGLRSDIGLLRKENDVYSYVCNFHNMKLEFIFNVLMFFWEIIYSQKQRYYRLQINMIFFLSIKESYVADY
jgi:hypothetical protein